MIVTREDANAMEEETYYFTYVSAMWATVAYLLIDTVVRMRRKPSYDFRAVMSLILKGEYEDAWQLVEKESGNEIADDIYLHIDTDSLEVTPGEARDRLDQILSAYNDEKDEVERLLDKKGLDS